MTSPLPPRGPSRAVRARRMIASLLAVALALPACSWLSDDKKPEADKLRSSIAEVARGLPADPVAAIEQLVVEVHRAEPDRAQAAVAEILRRSGLPIVSTRGPVVALPDELVLGDVPIYAELLPALAESVRAGDHYTVDELATMLHTLEITSRPIKFVELAGAVAGWGKEPDTDPVFASAAAAVRALGAQRGELLYAKANPESAFLDPLQMVLLAAHLGGSFTTVKASAKAAAMDAAPGLVDRLLGTGVAHADDGPCTATAKEIESYGKVRKDLVQILKAEIRNKFVNEMFSPLMAKDDIRQHLRGLSIISTAISSIMLMLYSRVDLQADKTKTHFKHQAGTRGEHVKIKATATFDPPLSQGLIDCYSLAGLKVPPRTGALKDFFIRWSVSQPSGRRIQEGRRLLSAVSADSEKMLHGGKTDGNGETTLELKPPVENPAGEGKPNLQGTAFVTAKLDMKNLPFSLGDLYGFAQNQAWAAFKKVFDLLAEMLTKIGLPEQSIAIDVDYHGTDVVLARGSSSVNLVLVELPDVYVDMVSCTGVLGPYKGTGGFSGAETNDFYRQAWAEAFGVNFPPKTSGAKRDIRPAPMADDNGRPVDFLIMKGDGGKQFLDGRLTLAPKSIREDVKKWKLYDGNRVGWTMGTVEILLAGKSFPFNNLAFPVLQVDEDPRCPAVEYYYDDL